MNSKHISATEIATQEIFLIDRDRFIDGKTPYERIQAQVENAIQSETAELREEAQEYWKQYQDLGAALSEYHDKFNEVGIGNDAQNLDDRVNEACKTIAELRRQLELAQTNHLKSNRAFAEATNTAGMLQNKLTEALARETALAAEVERLRGGLKEAVSELGEAYGLTGNIKSPYDKYFSPPTTPDTFGAKVLRLAAKALKVDRCPITIAHTYPHAEESTWNLTRLNKVVESLSPEEVKILEGVE